MTARCPPTAIGPLSIRLTGLMDGVEPKEKKMIVKSKAKYRFKKLNPVHVAWFQSMPASRERVEEYCLKIDQKGKKGVKQS